MTAVAESAAESRSPTPPIGASGVEYVFEPRSTSVLSLGLYVRDLWKRRRFMEALAKAELRAGRSSTVVGSLWAVLDPLFQAAIYWFLVAVIRGGKGGSVYLAMILSGVFLFNFTRIALSEGGRAILRGKGLMLNSTFPRALLPLASVYKGVLEFVPSVFVYALFHLALRAPIGQGIVLLPLLFALQVIMSTGMALLFATATVYIRDVSNLLNYILRVLIFVTPVIYPVSSLSITLQRALAWNPLFPLFSAYQVIITGGIPSAGLVLQSAAWAAFFLVIGIRVFRRHEHAFALYL